MPFGSVRLAWSIFVVLLNVRRSPRRPVLEHRGNRQQVLHLQGEVLGARADVVGAGHSWMKVCVLTWTVTNCGSPAAVSCRCASGKPNVLVYIQPQYRDRVARPAKLRPTILARGQTWAAAVTPTDDGTGNEKSKASMQSPFVSNCLSVSQPAACAWTGHLSSDLPLHT